MFIIEARVHACVCLSLRFRQDKLCFTSKLSDSTQTTEATTEMLQRETAFKKGRDIRFLVCVCVGQTSLSLCLSLYGIKLQSLHIKVSSPSCFVLQGDLCHQQQVEG